MVLEKKLFQYQEEKAGEKQAHRQQAVMVFFIPVVHGITADQQGQEDHAHFKPGMVNDINPEKRERAEKQGQEGTMNGAGQ